ncbi:MAG TPA: hypothetical protein PKE61_12790 [Burkholderiaceae bacterium]|nr:hypothetical protein [Burkholderiaceae bacterium]
MTMPARPAVSLTEDERLLTLARRRCLRVLSGFDVARLLMELAKPPV